MSKRLNHDNVKLLCSGCPQVIKDDQFLTCKKCKKHYHKLCIATTLNASDLRSTWECPECKSKKPRGDNSNTPIKPTQHSSTDSDTERQNITFRKKEKSLAGNDLTKNDIKEIINEECSRLKDYITKDIKAFLRELVRQELNTMKESIGAMQSSLQFMSSSYDSLKQEVDGYRNNVKVLHNETQDLKKEVRDLAKRLEIAEQHNRACNLEFQCIPEYRGENLVTTVLQIGKKISCNVKEEDIQLCTRVAKVNQESSRPRAVIVKFSTPRTRDSFLAQTIKFNKSNSSEKLHTGHLGIAGDKRPIYITEHLSPPNKAIHAAARKAAKEKGFKFVWTKQGKVFMRKTETSEFIYVKNIDMLSEL